MKKRIAFHVSFWVIYFFLQYFKDYYLVQHIAWYQELTIFIFQNIGLFYSLFYCFNKFSDLTLRTKIIGIFRFIIVIVIFSLLEYSRLASNEKLYFIVDIKFIFGYLFLAGAFFYYEKSIERAKKLYKSEKEKHELEQAFLRAQINPHFLFNTLNFIYTEASDYSKELAEAIYRLSEIMRYTLNEDINKNSKVPLQKEIDYIQNYIELNQLRFSHQLCIHFQVEGNTTGKMIPPMILMTFLENVFKHGELKDKENPITIQFNILPELMRFCFVNSLKKNLLHESSTGIGIENIRKRLEYIYGEKYVLETKQEGVCFTVLLEIHL